MLQKKSKILIIDDDETLLFGYERALTKTGYDVTTATSLSQARAGIMKNSFDAMVLDLKLSDGNALSWIPEVKTVQPFLAILVVTGTSDVTTAVQAIKSGAENYLVKPVEPESLETSLHCLLELSKLRKKDHVYHRITRKREPYMGTSPAMRQLLKQLTVVAASDTVVLLQGETGTGKGMLAKWIHDNGIRKDEPFIELNCSCIRGDLLRSELFGHARGAFTSAVSEREGLVAIADQGTLFLDEIGDMDMDVQTQLLKTLEEKTYRRVGENKVRKSEFRLICATHKNLLAETQKGTFRSDLYYRICVFPITISPLRDHIDDLEGLVHYILVELGATVETLAPMTIALLKEYSWPGNIRELRNMIERALLLAQSGPLTPECFPGLGSLLLPSGITGPGKTIGLHELERDYIKQIVDLCKGDKKKASEMIRISLATLYRKLK